MKKHQKPTIKSQNMKKTSLNTYSEPWLRRTSLSLIGLCLVALWACKDEDEVKNIVTPPDEKAVTAQFRVTFGYTWSATTHPTNFPNDPHFSPFIGATHTNAFAMWAVGNVVGTSAESGMELMAETGSQSALRANFKSAGDVIDQVISGKLTTSPNNDATTFTTTRSYPLLSVVSMLAPSPDWFVGIHDVSLLDDLGNWIEKINMDMRVYDAGTDSGLQYGAENNDTSPKAAITRLTSATADTDFNNGLPKAGVITIERMP